MLPEDGGIMITVNELVAHKTLELSFKAGIQGGESLSIGLTLLIFRIRGIGFLPVI